MKNSGNVSPINWFLSLIVVGCIAIAVTFILPPIAWAADSAPSPNAAELFDVHCAGCHAHGGNIIRRGKTLKQRSLKRHGYDTKAAIVEILTNGKSPMSSYRERLSPNEIQHLAQYVLDQAEQNWP